MIRDCATLLGNQDYASIALILGQHGISQQWPDEDDSMSDFVVRAIQWENDDVLLSLHTYLTSESGAVKPGKSPWSGNNRLRIFLSHVASHADVVSEVSSSLGKYGVETFVAHSIDPSKEWQAVIEAALAECDALVAFLHPSFTSSLWCSQEVGWAIGRARPILPLNYGLNPFGFMGKFQGQQCVDVSPYKVARSIMDWLSNIPSLHGRLTSGLVDAFVGSPSWDFTRSVAPYLERIEAVRSEDLARMETAAKENVDISKCVIPVAAGGHMSGPAWVERYVAQRRKQGSAG